jgi:predicted nucleotidyltransferase
MKMTVDIKPEHLEVIQQILNQHLPAQAIVYAFGSRAKMTAKKFSDLDLAIDMAGQPIPLKVMAMLMNDFEHSSLPYKVDIVDWADIDESFREIINQDKVKLA